MPLISALLGLLFIGDAASPVVRSTVWIRAGGSANGSGWVVDADRRWVVTARHVVGDADAVDVQFLDHRLAHAWTDRRHYLSHRADLDRRGLIARGRVIARRDRSDLVLLALDRLPAAVPALQLARRPALPGEPCRLIGHRHDAERLWNLTAGQVRQSGRLGQGFFWAGRRVAAGVPVVLLQAPVEIGESGAAVVNEAGEVVGVVSAVVNAVPGSAFAIDATEVRSLLVEAGRTMPPAEDPASPRDADRLARATVWVRPQSTNGRFAGVLIDRERSLVLTSAAAVGNEPVVAVIAPRWYCGRLVAEAEAYTDRPGLRLAGQCVPGMVLGRDPVRDLALIELDAGPTDLEAIRLTAAEPRLGEPVATVEHPTGIDLLWLYAAGVVRSVGSVELGSGPGDEQSKVRASLLQLPHQGSASGGPVANAAGELIGVLAARVAPRKDLAYAATPAEVRAFLDGTRPLWDPQTPADWIRRGRFALKLGRTDRAAMAFRSALESAPGDPGASTGLAAALAAEGKIADALRVADAIAVDRADAATRAELSNVYRVADQPHRAAELVGKALKIDPRCAAALVVRARLRSGSAALDDLAAALAIDPAYGPAYRARAERRDTSSNDGRRLAITDLGRALEANPVDVEALRGRAAMFLGLKEPKKAVADWSRVTELQALDADNWIGLARAHFAADDRSGAAEALRSVLRVDPDRRRKVFGVVRELGRELEKSDPTDPARVPEWYALALARLAAWLPR